MATAGGSLDFDVKDLTHTIGPEVMINIFNLPYNKTNISQGYNQRYKIW